jgi:hypothetical protein
MNPLVREMVISFLVRALGYGGTFLVTKGILSEAEAATYATGLAAMLFSIGYGLYTSYTSRQKLVTGLAASPGTTEADVEASIKEGYAASVKTAKTAVPVIKEP